MAKARLGDLIEALSEAADLKAAAVPLVAIGKAIGLERPAVVEDFTAKDLLMSQNQGIMGELFGWKSLQAYREGSLSMHQVCPIGRACRVSISPFAWRAADIGSAKIAWDERSQEFWLRAAEQGIVGGITVPVHMPLSRIGAVGWLSVDPSLDLDVQVQTYSNELRLTAHLFMDKVFRERPDTSRLPLEASLTERELECLTWVALGKTDSEIGELIGRSPSTARFHVESAVDKLGVNNRTRAAAVASQMGMIRAVA